MYWFQGPLIWLICVRLNETTENYSMQHNGKSLFTSRWDNLTPYRLIVSEYKVKGGNITKILNYSAWYYYNKLGRFKTQPGVF